MIRILYYLIILVVLMSSCSPKTLSISHLGEERKPAPATFQFYPGETEFTDFEWELGDGTRVKDSTASHTYYLSGNYTVTLKGTNGKKIKEVQKQVYVDAPDKCLVKIETTYGTMIAELYDKTPKHRDNFIKLAEEGYYEDLLFHRVISGFMIQGGDPNSRGATAESRLGTGGPGYQVDAEITEDLAHVKGALAAARIGGPANPQKKSSGSQFYIVQGKQVDDRQIAQIEARLGLNYPESIRSHYLEHGGTPFLDQEYTVFGQVIEGLEIVDEIAKVRTAPGDRPLEDVWMKVTVIK